MHQPDKAILLFLLFFISSSLTGQVNVDSLSSLIKTSSSDVDRAKSAILLAKHYLSIDLNKTKEYASKALEYTADLDSLNIEANDQLARYYFFKSQLDTSLIYFQKSREIAHKNHDEKIVSSINISIASVYLRQSRYNEAIELLIENVQYFEDQNDPVNVGKCYVNISAAQAELGNYEQAISYSEQALSIFNDYNEDAIKLIVLPNLATQYLKYGDTTRAVKTFLEAESFAISQNNKRSLALTYNNLGELYLSQKKYDQAKVYIERSIDSKKSINLLKGIETNYHNLGVVLAAQGQHNEAIKWYNKALENSDASYKSAIYEKLKDSNKSLGKVSKALSYAELSRALSDSLQTEIDYREFTEISAKYEASQKEVEILALQNKNQQLELVKNRNQTYLFGSLGILLSAILLTFFYIKNQKRKQIIQRQKHEFQQKEMIEKIKEQELETIDRIVEGQEEERIRIAEDLHDSLGSKMATLKLYIDNVNADEGIVSLVKARELADIAYKEVRNISHNINSGVLTDKGLLPAIRKMTSYIADHNDLEIEIIDIDVSNRLDNATEIQLFRVLQELITNVLKHAGASHLTIQLTGYQEALNIMVEDNGKGFDKNMITRGMGLSNLEKRLAKIGASYEIDSSVGRGTNVMINVPL